jgi:oligopeptide/dipeptide ABC transporter ATP-binding protein
MYAGEIVEQTDVVSLFRHPQHPYTRALLSVVPMPNPTLRRKMVILSGETPNPINLPPGCRFHPRCPIAVEACHMSDPLLEDVGSDHQVACLLNGAPSKGVESL